MLAVKEQTMSGQIDWDNKYNGAYYKPLVIREIDLKIKI